MDFFTDPQALLPFLQKEFLGNTAKNWLIAAGVFIGVFVVLRIVIRVAISRIQKLAKKTSLRFDNAIVQIVGKLSVFFYFAASLYAASTFLSLPSNAGKFIYGLFILAAVFESIGFLQKAILFFVERVWLKGRDDEQQASYILGILIRIALWAVGILLVLSNLGFDVTSLIASLGIGGIAVALAVQNTLGDLFSSLSIYVDKPFKVGDFIIVGDHLGVVKKIGLKTTRIQALQGEELVISNNELTSTRIQNFKKMEKRRVPFSFGVIYGTTPGQLKKIPGIVSRIIKSLEDTEFDRAHFKSFGDSSLDFEVVYYIFSSDYNEYMDIQQSVNIAIIEEFEKEGIEMAFPTRTVHLINSN